MAIKHTNPKSVVDTLLHAKVSTEDCEEGEEKVILPMTRYDNVMNSPDVVRDINGAPGAPFVLYVTGETELSYLELRNLCGDIM